MSLSANMGGACCLLYALCWQGCAPGASQPVVAAANGQPGNAALLAPSGWAIPLPDDAAAPRATGAAGHGAGPMASRGLSASGVYTVSLQGVQRLSSGGTVSDSGTASRLDSGTAGQGLMSYALYELPMADMQPAALSVAISLLPRSGGGASTYWLGLADYASGLWQWHGPLSDAIARIEPLGVGCLSFGGDMFVAVVAYDGSSFECMSLSAEVPGLMVGPGKTYAAIEDAYADAVAGDAILVFPQDGGAPYSDPALQVHKSGISFRGVVGPGGERVKLSGAGFNYTGAGSTPRAVFQFNDDADGCSVAGFEILEAHNDSYNGAAVRINKANDITVRNCEIHDCDMGMMSNGDGTLSSSANQRIERCLIHHNGNLSDPGYNHNLYLGGTSVTLSACEVHSSLTGHNVKSRAHFNRIEYCYVHDSANREFDLVDAAETAFPGSHSVLIGNVIVKDPACPGNRGVIHFGQDGGGEHNGTLYLVNDTVVTPFITPVVTLSATGAGAAIYNAVVWDTGSFQSGQQLVGTAGGAQLASVSGGSLWLSAGMSIAAGTTIPPADVYTAQSGETPPFTDPANADRSLCDFHLSAAGTHMVDMGLDWDSIAIPTGPGQPVVSGIPFAYRIPLSRELRRDSGPPDLGAYAWGG